MSDPDAIPTDHHPDVRVDLTRATASDDYLVELSCRDQPAVPLAWFEARLLAARLHEAGEMARSVNGVGAVQAHVADWVTWLATDVIGYDVGGEASDEPSDAGPRA